jgi:hypothetical protein
MKRAKWTLAVLLVGVAACSDPIETESANVLGLRSGTSFGMCAGYCLTELIIEETSVRFNETGWPTHSNLPPKTRTVPLTQRERAHLQSLIDLSELERLEGVHGCPDCADGGTEWIELRTANDTIRVTFEFGRELAPIAELQAAIRAQRERFPRER